ncbi:hypothetical protein B7463_g643, partial [Scytalidium lignicola]
MMANHGVNAPTGDASIPKRANDNTNHTHPLTKKICEAISRSLANASTGNQNAANPSGQTLATSASQAVAEKSTRDNFVHYVPPQGGPSKPAAAPKPRRRLPDAPMPPVPSHALPFRAPDVANQVVSNQGAQPQVTANQVTQGQNATGNDVPNRLVSNQAAQNQIPAQPAPVQLDPAQGRGQYVPFQQFGNYTIGKHVVPLQAAQPCHLGQGGAEGVYLDRLVTFKDSHFRMAKILDDKDKAEGEMMDAIQKAITHAEWSVHMDRTEMRNATEKLATLRRSYDERVAQLDQLRALQQRQSDKLGRR